MQKKPKVMFVIAYGNYVDQANKFITNVRKFHTEEELPIVVVDQKKVESYGDPHFLYRATPVIARELIQEYELVIKADTDQICLGSLSHIWEHQDYDIGTVLNINRVDPGVYGFVTTSVIDPSEYYNCGFVAMRNEDFVKKWYNLCFSGYFGKLQYREQDLLNLICHFGNFKVKCFDRYDLMNNVYAWWGLVAKGEGMKMVLTDDKKVIVPVGKDNYPDHEMEVKLYHQAGGNSEVKMNYRTWFPEPIIEYIEWLRDEK